MPHRPLLCLAPLGPVDPYILRCLSKALARRLSLQAEILPDRPLPAGAFNAVRDQYHSTRLLEYLLEDKNPNHSLILGITAADLYIPIFTFVFGEAQLNGRAAVVSLFRPAGGAEGVRPARPLLLKRLLKLSLHELGHNLGLGHCREPHCLMGFSSNLEKLDQKELAWCEYCGILLADAFKGGGGPPSGSNA